MSMMLYPCMLCVAMLMCLFVLCVACLTVFVNCLVKQFAMCSGHILKLFKEISRLLLHMQTFNQRVVDSWNNLPVNVVNAQSINAFKIRSNTHT